MAAAITSLLIFLLAVVLAWLLPGQAMGQNCRCAPNLCCSGYGYCGTGAAYCGTGCKEGPCYRSSGSGGRGPSRGHGTSVEAVVSPAFFNAIKSKSARSCAGQRFYTRKAFLTALNHYSLFGKEGSVVDAKREIAAFFAHATLETGRTFT